MNGRMSFLVAVFVLFIQGVTRPSQEVSQSEEIVQTLSLGGASIQFYRKTQEDTFGFKAIDYNDIEYIVAAVFDGHGGKKVSELANERFYDLFENNLKNQTINKKNPIDVEVALKKAIQDCENLFLPQYGDYWGQGSTLVASVITSSGYCYLANVGDSRAFFKKTVENDTVKSYFVTTDHKPHNEEEKKYIKKAGGIVERGRVYLDKNSLAMSRAIGDNHFKYREGKQLKRPIVRATPDITRCVVQKGSYVILASDGFWDNVSPRDLIVFMKAVLTMTEEELCEYYKLSSSPLEFTDSRRCTESGSIAEKIAQLLIRFSSSRVSRDGDNTTVVVQMLL